MYSETVSQLSATYTQPTDGQDKQLLIFLNGLKDELGNLRALNSRLANKANLLVGTGNQKVEKDPSPKPLEATLMNELFNTLDSIRFVRREIEDTDITFNSVF